MTIHKTVQSRYIYSTLTESRPMKHDIWVLSIIRCPRFQLSSNLFQWCFHWAGEDKAFEETVVKIKAATLLPIVERILQTYMMVSRPWRLAIAVLHT